MEKDKIFKISLLLAAIGCVALFSGCVEKNKELSIPENVYLQKSDKIVFPENISQFKLYSNETVNKTFVGTNITEMSAVYLPNEGKNNGINAVMIRVIKYPHNSVKETSETENSISGISVPSNKDAIIKDVRDRLSNYYSQIDINPSFLPDVIGSMIKSKQVSSFSSTSGVPTIDETVITQRDSKNGTVKQIQDLTIHYARVTVYTTAKYDNKEISNVLSQIWNSTLEII
jgi:hypothetical protein